MEPVSPSPDASPQMSPEFRPEQLPQPTPEMPIRQPELPAIQPEIKGAEQQIQGQGGDPTWQATQLAAAAMASATPAAPTAITPVVVDTPMVANDDDVIEQEWVQKAKKIVANTKSDPYLQEQEVSKLQADYLQKRYGKTIKIPSE